MTIRGLTIEKFTARGIDVGADSLVRNNEVRDVHQVGIRFVGGTRVLGNYVHHIGALGLSGSGDGAVVEGNEVAFNNAADYRTVRGGCWTAGGSKWVLTTRLTVRNNSTHDNSCDGFWSDIDNIDTLYDGNRVERNDRAGLNIEISYRTTIRNNIPPAFRGGVLIVQQSRGSGRYRPHLAQKVSVHDNTIVVTAGVTGAIGLPQVFRQNNRFAGNRYVVPRADGQWWTWAGGPRTWSAWRADGHDATGVLEVGARDQ